MNLMNRMMSSESNPKLNINKTVKGCEYEECTNIQIIKYPPLIEEEIEQIIKERYDYKDEKTKTFIRKALRKHGDRYDYSDVVYIKSDEKVEIICRVEGHKPFPQTPDAHLRGQGCKLCGIKNAHNKQRMTNEEFAKRGNEIHGEGTYDYSKVEYINYHTNVIIICPKHGPFPQTPANHLKGCGCSDCRSEKLAEQQRLTKEEFIEKANEKQGEGTYDYSKVNYVDMFTHVIIICPKHGPFPQTPLHHLNGEGCPRCKKNKGEESVRRFLTEKGIEFEEQKTFEGCEYKRQLKFDFYLPKYNLCIESDGNVHSDKINWNGKLTNEQMEEKLKLNQHRDNIKNEYCKNNGIGLLRVNNRKAYEELTNYFNRNKYKTCSLNP